MKFKIQISVVTCVVWDNIKRYSLVFLVALNNNLYPGIPRWARQSCRAANPWAVHGHWALLYRDGAEPEDKRTVSTAWSVSRWTVGYGHEEGRGKLWDIQPKTVTSTLTLHYITSGSHAHAEISYLRRAGLSGAAVCWRKEPCCKMGVSTALLMESWGWKK